MARLTIQNGCESPAKVTSGTFADFTQAIENTCESPLSQSENAKRLIPFAKVAKVVSFDFRKNGDFPSQVVENTCESRLSQHTSAKSLILLAKVAKVISPLKGVRPPLVGAAHTPLGEGI